jgi:hypothetical protein
MLIILRLLPGEYQADLMRKDKEADRIYKREWQRLDRAKNPEKYTARERARYAASEAVRADSAWRARTRTPEQKARQREYTRRWQRNNAERTKATRVRRELRKRYGLTPEDYERMRTEQNGACPICMRPFEDRPRAVHVDHCHTTGRVRGLLCESCNLGIGKFRDCPDSLRRAAEYIER